MTLTPFHRALAGALAVILTVTTAPPSPAYALRSQSVREDPVGLEELRETLGVEEPTSYPLPAFDLTLEVPRGVFPPTHPTSHLLLEVLDRLAPWLAKTPRGAAAEVLEVGVGPGSTALAALRRGAASVVGLDVEPAAVEAARANAQRNGLADRFQAAKGDLLESEILRGPAGRGPFDLVMFNADTHQAAMDLLYGVANRSPPILREGGVALLIWKSQAIWPDEPPPYHFERIARKGWRVRALLTAPDGNWTAYAMARSLAALDALQDVVTPGRVIVAGLEEPARPVAPRGLRVVRTALQRLLRGNLVKLQRRGRGALDDAKALAAEAVEGLHAAAAAAGVDVTDQAAVEAFVTLLVSSRAYLVATGHGSRFSPRRLIPKQRYPADGLVSNVKRALEPAAFTTEPPVVIVDGIVAYHLLAPRALTDEARTRILASLEQRWSSIFTDAGLAQDHVPWKDIRSAIERQLVWAWDPEQRADLAAAARVFQDLLQSRVTGPEAEGQREVVWEGFLDALFRPIVEWTTAPDQENPYLDPEKVERYVGRRAIVALGAATGPGGALEAGYRRLEALKVPPATWDLPVYSDRVEDAFPIVPNVYVTAFLKALASYRQGRDQAALLVVGGKLPGTRGPRGRGQLLFDPETGMPLLTEWGQLTVEEQAQVKQRWDRWTELDEADQSARLRASPQEAPWVNLGAFVAQHAFGRQALAAMIRDPERWGHPDPKKADRREYWYTDWPAYRLAQLAAQPEARPRVDVVLIPEEAPEGSKDAERVMALRRTLRRRHLIPSVPKPPAESLPARLAGARLVRLDRAAIRSLIDAEDQYAAILAVLESAAQPIRRFQGPGRFEGDLLRITRQPNGPVPWSTPAPVATAAPETALVRHPDRYVPGAARLDQLDAGNREGLLAYLRTEVRDMVADLVPARAERARLLGEIEASLGTPAALALTGEQLYQQIFQRLRVWASGKGITDPWARAKAQFEPAVQAVAAQLLRRVQAARPESLPGLFEELALLTTRANLMDSHSDAARRLFRRPGFFGALARNLQAAAPRLAINGLERYRQLALGPNGLVLYVTDNFEEAYLDVVMAAWLTRRGHTVVLAGKAAPARGDATVQDLERIRNALIAQQPGAAWLLRRIQVISSGTDTFGTLLHQATPEFAQALQTARFIVLKGQANLYTTVAMNALATPAPVVLSLLSKGFTAQLVTGVPRPRSVIVDDAEIFLITQPGEPLDVEEVVQEIFVGTDQIEIQGRLYLEPTVRIADGTAFQGTVVLTGDTIVGAGRLLKDVVAHDTRFEGHPRLDAFSYQPPPWRTQGRIEGKDFDGEIVPWRGVARPRTDRAGLEETTVAMGQAAVERPGTVAVRRVAFLIPSGLEETELYAIAVGLEEARLIAGRGIAPSRIVAVAGGLEEAAAIQALGVPDVQVLLADRYGSLEAAIRAAIHLAGRFLTALHGVRTVQVLRVVAGSLADWWRQLPEPVLRWLDREPVTPEREQDLMRLGV